MSMFCKLVLASDECIDYLAKHPEDVSSFLWGNDLHDKPDESNTILLGRLLSRLLGRPYPEKPQRTHPQQHQHRRFEGDDCDIGVEWHGLQFLLTGSAWEDTGPLSILVAEGIPLGKSASEFGFKSLPISELHSALSQIDTGQLKQRFDPKRMLEEEIYPLNWETPDALETLLNTYRYFQEFVTKASTGGYGIIRSIG